MLTCNVLHALECHLALIDLLHGARLQAIDQLTQQHSILEYLIEVLHVSGGAGGLTRDLLNPLETLRRQFIAILGVDLCRRKFVPN